MSSSSSAPSSPQDSQGGLILATREITQNLSTDNTIPSLLVPASSPPCGELLVDGWGPVLPDIPAIVAVTLARRGTDLHSLPADKRLYLSTESACWNPEDGHATEVMLSKTFAPVTKEHIQIEELQRSLDRSYGLGARKLVLDDDEGFSIVSLLQSFKGKLKVDKGEAEALRAAVIVVRRPTPSRPMNATLAFMFRRRAQLRDILPPGLETGRISQYLGSEWKHLPEDQRGYWKDLYANYLEEFRNRAPEYKFTRAPNGQGKASFARSRRAATLVLSAPASAPSTKSSRREAMAPYPRSRPSASASGSTSSSGPGSVCPHPSTGNTSISAFPLTGHVIAVASSSRGSGHFGPVVVAPTGHFDSRGKWTPDFEDSGDPQVPNFGFNAVHVDPWSGHDSISAVSPMQRSGTRAVISNGSDHDSGARDSTTDHVEPLADLSGWPKEWFDQPPVSPFDSDDNSADRWLRRVSVPVNPLTQHSNAHAGPSRGSGHYSPATVSTVDFDDDPADRWARHVSAPAFSSTQHVNAHAGPSRPSGHCSLATGSPTELYGTPAGSSTGYCGPLIIPSNRQLGAPVVSSTQYLNAYAGPSRPSGHYTPATTSPSEWCGSPPGSSTGKYGPATGLANGQYGIPAVSLPGQHYTSPVPSFGMSGNPPNYPPGYPSSLTRLSSTGPHSTFTHPNNA